MLHWTELKTVDSSGEENRLDTVVKNNPLCSMDLNDQIPVTGLDGYFVFANGENPDWDTPKVQVDWTGFRELVTELRNKK